MRAPGFRNLEVIVDEQRPAVALRGGLDLADAGRAARLLGEMAAAAAPRRLEVDASGLEFIDSSGLACLVSADREGRELGGGLRLAVGPGPVRRLLELVDPGGNLLPRRV
jgi:anti-sigma B factor antagonist